jgi:hypothetical protein
MELDAENGPGLVVHGHDLPIRGPGVSDQGLRKPGRRNGKRMVANDIVFIRQAFEQAGAVMSDAGKMPASSGVQGPGESTTPAGASARASFADISSLRITLVRPPACST